MKKIRLLLILQIVVSTLYSQQKPLLLNPIKDKKEMNGYIVRLKMAPGNTVLFDLFKGPQVVFSPHSNPIALLPNGFLNKEDAFKVAEWMIDKFGTTGHFPPMMPLAVGRLLKISTTVPQPAPVN